MVTTATSAPKSPRAALPPARGRAGLAGAIRSEWTKIRTVRSTYWTIFALAVVSLGLCAAITGGLSSQFSEHNRHPANFDVTQMSLFAFLYIAVVVIAVLGAMVITSEYSTGMIRTSLTAQPRRLTFYAAKILVFGAVAYVVSLVISFVSFFIGRSFFASAGLSASLSQPHVLRALLAAALYVMVAGLLVLGLGAIVRHTAAAIAIGIFVLSPVLGILVNLLPGSWSQDVDRWLPTSSWEGLIQTVGSSSDPHLFSMWPQFGVTAGWAVVALIVGGVLLYTRDA